MESCEKPDLAWEFVRAFVIHSIRNISSFIDESMTLMQKVLQACLDKKRLSFAEQTILYTTQMSENWHMIQVLSNQIDERLNQNDIFVFFAV